ncbi:unnamed protein product [Blepharisma stoltei]|uniref:Histone H2A n=1 Tax=Blepharisma stoltei TaxID=1481888 RepID=A0AAU9IPT4_9CILI|nr:unnamed protein product [Blepharisma stoltei]
MSKPNKLSFASNSSDHDSQSSTCDLIFPIFKISKKIKKAHIAPSTSQKASVFLTAVLEYLTAEVLDIAGDVSLQRQKKCIKPSHIKHAISHDEELGTLLGDISLRGAAYGTELANATSSQSFSESSTNSHSSQSLSDQD